MDRAKIPPIINCRTICQKDNRQLIWIQADLHAEKANVHAGIATSMKDYLAWKDRIPMVGLVLLEMDDKDLEMVQKYKVNLFVTQAVFAKYPREVWVSLQVSVAVLEDIGGQFPILQHAWDGTPIDAVACATLMLHYSHLIVPAGTTLNAIRQEQLAGHGVKILREYQTPPQIWFLTQYFVHKNTKRQREIRQCLKNNMANPLIDKIVLLNEEDLKYEWSSARNAEKVQQVIIKKRLTYADLLKYTCDKVPPNTIVIFANADIYCNETLKHLYSVNMTDKLFALLRYDEQEGGELRIFGPRPDSQDTWICLSDSVKRRTWDFPSFEYRLGTAGCDNRFTGDMFGMRFLVSNPCQAIQTVHLHNTAIRDYNPKDIVPAKLYMYIHPCSIVEIDQKIAGEDKVAALSPRSTTVTIKGVNAKKTQTYCTMLARENRFKWTDGANVTEAKPLAIYKWKDAFVTHCGVVYDYKNIWLGPVETSNGFVEKVGRDLGISFLNPCSIMPSMLAIPSTVMSHMMNVDLYCLYYLAYALQIYPLIKGTVPNIFIYPEAVKTLQSFKVPHGSEAAVPAIVWNPTACAYAKEVYGFIPEVPEVSPVEIGALRSALSIWQHDPGTKCVVLVDELLTPLFVEESLVPLLPVGWTVEQVLRTRTGIEAYHQIVGAGLCLLYNLPKQEEHWAKLWTLPIGCKTLEFQNELKVEGGFQHLAGAALLDCYCIPLHKGTPSEMRQQLLTQFTMWLEAHPLVTNQVVTDAVTNQGVVDLTSTTNQGVVDLTSTTNQGVVDPTDMFLSL